uniref:Predicted ATPase n=1 Tax=Candidatus Kentrum sp. DK TaxID=2126562 RepID=A0A450S1Z8_9GAMM|nr:MAG: Predicted ATPase [Candidatus Kentron sp. DK]
MPASTFLTRVVLRNYKSITSCDVRLGPLTYLVGPNGSGKSTFLDALRFVRDALIGTLDNALNERGGFSSVRSLFCFSNDFGIRFEFRTRDGQSAHYAFQIGISPEGRHEVQREECSISGGVFTSFFHVEKGKGVKSSEPILPLIMTDRLMLQAVSGLPKFRPLFDALMAMSFYHLDPKRIREYQKPQDGRVLKSAGENIVSVIDYLGRNTPESMGIIREYLQKVVPAITTVTPWRAGTMETLAFGESHHIAADGTPYQLLAENMSDGTLRALGILTALFQGSREYSPTLIGIEEPESALHPAAAGALREALQRASERTQIIVTSHSPDLLDDMALPPESLLTVTLDGGSARFAPSDEGSKKAMREHLFSAGELLRLNQLEPDSALIGEQKDRRPDLFGKAGP